MLKQSLGSLVLALGLAAAAQAVELTQIDRAIGRQPEYKYPPKYCLLVFGPEATTRVWLVMDGDVLYVDRNANGDLTDAGERFLVSASSSQRSVGVPTITQQDGTQHTNLNFFPLQNDQFRLNIRTRGELCQFVGWGLPENPTLTTDRTLAPVIHFGGPQTFAPYGSVPAVASAPDASGHRQASLRLILGTPGHGPGTFAAVRCFVRSRPLPADKDYDLIVEHARYILAHKQSPTARLEYISRETGKTIQAEVQSELVSRCGVVLEYGPLPIPTDAANGVIQARIAYPDSKDGPIAPATLPILLQ